MRRATSTILMTVALAACGNDAHPDEPVLANDTRFATVEQTEWIEVQGGAVKAARDEVLVFLDFDAGSATLEAVEEKVDDLDGDIVGGLADLRIIQVRVPEDADELRWLVQLRAVPGVHATSLNRLVRPARGPDVDVPSFRGDWWIEQIHASAAWDVTKGLAGSETRIGLVDFEIGDGSGVLDPGRLTRLDTDGGVFDGPTVSAEPHGRTTLGFAAGFHRHGDRVVRGVAWDNDVVAVELSKVDHACEVDEWGVRLFCEPRFASTDVLAGLKTAIDNGATVVNLSIGPDDTCNTASGARAANLRAWRLLVAYAAEYAQARGSLLVASAGNACEKSDDQRLPDDARFGWDALESHALFVGASTVEGTDADFSNAGRAVDLFAPGEAVAFGGWIAGDRTEFFGLSSRASGTSFATPLVTGSAGLVSAANPTLLPPEVRQLLLATASGEMTVADEPAMLLDAHAA